MDRWIGKLAIVTGASAGIGEDISRDLVHKGVNVLGLARREERLKQLSKSLEGCKGSFYFMKCDVRNEKDILDAFEYAENIFGGVDILINNAGIARLADFEESSTDDFRAVMETNVLAAAICTKQALKSMRKHQKEGHIVNINSVLGRNAKSLLNFPIGLYPASKFAMRAMTDTLRLDIAEKKDKIRVTTIYPGPVKTEILGDIDDFVNKYEGYPYLQSYNVSESVLFVLSVPCNVQIEDLVITPLHNTL